MPGLEREDPNQVPMSDCSTGSFNVICLVQHGFLTFSSRFGFNVICLVQHGFLAALLHLIAGSS